MTLVIALRCTDGLVMASDGMSTEAAPLGAGLIAKHETGDKIVIRNLCKSLETWFLNQASERYANDDQSPAWTFGQPDDRHADE
jgi:hypothetical protein